MKDASFYEELESKYKKLKDKHKNLESKYRDLKAASNILYRARLAGYSPPAMKYPSRVSREYLDFLLAPEKTALLVMDMQNMFCAPGGQMYVPHYADIVPNINRLVEYFRRAEMAVIWIRGVANDDFSDRGLTEWKYERARLKKIHTSDSWDAQFLKELDGPNAGEIVIEKHKRDVFHGSYIDATLMFFGIESLVFTGVATDNCVGNAVIHSHFKDYNPIIVIDAVAARTAQRQQIFFERMEESWARLLTADQVVAELTALALPKGFKTVYSQRKRELKKVKRALL